MGKRAAMIADRCPRWQCGMRWQRQQPSIRCEGIGWQGSAEGVQQFCPFERRGEGVQSPKRRDANRINSLCWVSKVLLAWSRSPGILLEDIEARDGPIPRVDLGQSDPLVALGQHIIRAEGNRNTARSVVGEKQVCRRCQNGKKQKDAIKSAGASEGSKKKTASGKYLLQPTPWIDDGLPLSHCGNLQLHFSPTAAKALCASGLAMNVFQTKFVRWFSAINMVMPTLIPMTSGSYHPLSGLKASTNP